MIFNEQYFRLVIGSMRTQNIHGGLDPQNPYPAL